jgi:extracellular factor (EF) 3-hydroxypalmitic acid methyl ester biosynthesis protein
MTTAMKTASDENEEALPEQPESHVAELKPDGERGVSKGRSIRDRKFRARRIHIPDLAIENLVAKARHSSLGDFEARVEDLSLYGMRLLSIRGDEPGLFLSGDRLDGIRLTAGDQLLYSGVGRVRRVSEDSYQWVLGVELEGPGVDLDALYRLDHRVSIAERLRTAVREHEGVSQEFKAWVADLLDFFETTKQCLDREEARLAESDLWTREEAMRDCIGEAAPVVCERLNQASLDLAGLVRGFDDNEHSVHQRFYRRHLCKFYHRAPLLRRAYYKPLGYAGDYEMMNMLYRDHAEGDTLFGRVLNVYACQEAAAQANINRISYFDRRIRALIEQNPKGRLRIASIGCGPAHEIKNLLQRHPELGERIDIALVDQEERAIQYCERTLAPLAASTGARIHFIGESIRRLLTARSLGDALGTRDLIYSAGLFDYLSDRSFEALIRALYGATAEGGHMYIGNVNLDANTTKWSMEYASDWHLIHRTKRQLLDLTRGLPTNPGLVEVESEPLGVNLFLHIMR